MESREKEPALAGDLIAESLDYELDPPKQPPPDNGTEEDYPLPEQY